MEAATPPKLDLSPGGLGRGQLTARPTTRWERALTRVKLPFPCFQGFPALASLGKLPLPGVGGVAPVKAGATLPHGCSPTLPLSIGWPIRSQYLSRAGHSCLTGCWPGWSKQLDHWTQIFYKARAAKTQEGTLFQTTAVVTCLEQLAETVMPEECRGDYTLATDDLSCGKITVYRGK